MKKRWKKVEVDFFQEATVPASKKKAEEFSNCSTWDAATVHNITPWFSSVAAGLQSFFFFFLQTGSTWRWHSWSWKILSAVSMSHPSARGLAIHCCWMVFWWLVAPWTGCPVLSASSGPVGMLQLSSAGSDLFRRCSIRAEHKRGQRRASPPLESQEAGHVRCCLLQVGGMSTCLSFVLLVSVPTGPWLPRARAGSVAEEWALRCTPT